MKQKIEKLSPSATAFFAFMMKVKNKTTLEVMREFNEKASQRKIQDSKGK